MAGLRCRLLLCLAAVWAAAAADLQLEEARRTVDLSTHLAKVSAELSLANAPGGPAASSFLLALEPGLEPRLAYLGVQVSAGSGGEPREPGQPQHGPGLQGHVGTAPRPGPPRRDTSAAGGPAAIGRNKAGRGAESGEREGGRCFLSASAGTAL